MCILLNRTFSACGHNKLFVGRCLLPNISTCLSALDTQHETYPSEPCPECHSDGHPAPLEAPVVTDITSTASTNPTEAAAAAHAYQSTFHDIFSILIIQAAYHGKSRPYLPTEVPDSHLQILLGVVRILACRERSCIGRNAHTLKPKAQGESTVNLNADTALINATTLDEQDPDRWCRNITSCSCPDRSDGVHMTNAARATVLSLFTPWWAESEISQLHLRDDPSDDDAPAAVRARKNACRIQYRQQVLRNMRGNHAAPLPSGVSADPTEAFLQVWYPPPAALIARVETILKAEIAPAVAAARRAWAHLAEDSPEPADGIRTKSWVDEYVDVVEQLLRLAATLMAADAGLPRRRAALVMKSLVRQWLGADVAPRETAPTASEVAVAAGLVEGDGGQNGLRGVDLRMDVNTVETLAAVQSVLAIGARHHNGAWLGLRSYLDDAFAHASAVTDGFSAWFERLMSFRAGLVLVKSLCHPVAAAEIATQVADASDQCIVCLDPYYGGTHQEECWLLPCKHAIGRRCLMHLASKRFLLAGHTFVTVGDAHVAGTVTCMICRSEVIRRPFDDKDTGKSLSQMRWMELTIRGMKDFGIS